MEDFIVNRIREVLDSINSIGSGIIVQSPEAFNSGIYNGVQTLMTSAVMPIAYVILGLFFMYEIYGITIRTDLSQGISSVEVPFKVMFKLAICKAFIDSTVLILNAIYSISSSIISKVSFGSSGGGVAQLDIEQVRAIVEKMDFSTKLMTSVEVLLIWFIVMFVGVMITVVVVGRMLELYILFAIAPIPLATIPNSDMSSVAKNFLKNFAAVSLQGTLIFIVVAMFGLLLGTFGNVTDPKQFESAMLKTAGYSIILLMALFQTSRWSKSICNAM